MSQRSARGDSSSAAHKRHATAPQDEGPLPSASASASASLAHQVSSSSISKIPLDLIADLIIPFVADRATWNSLHCASKELCLAGKKMIPPWPNTAFKLGSTSVLRVTFSPSGSHLAFATTFSMTEVHNGESHAVIHLWDRWGKETLLVGYTGCIFCLEYSLDGEYLASGCEDGSIRIWHSGPFHTTSSMTPKERSSQTRAQVDKILLSSGHIVKKLSFSRTNSTLLASAGGSNGSIKVWNIKDQACIHSFDTGGGRIRSLFFAGGADSACVAVANAGSVIRLSRAEGSSDFATEIIGEAAGQGGSIPTAVLSSCGSFLVTCTGSMTEYKSTLALYELETMTKTQSVVIPDFSAASCFAVVSPNSKQLVVGDNMGRIRLFQTDDFSIQRDINTRRGSSSKDVWSLAFDPTCRVLAFGYRDGTVELRTL
jgi:WD40 repeat protein